MQENKKKEKVGILTFTYGDNYGQRLQNLAVQEIFKQFGFTVYTIPQVVPSYQQPKNKGRHRFFENFDYAYIHYYPDSIGKHKTPVGLKEFSYFVAGSDQIWSPYSLDVNDSFFLRFAPKEKRIAFSPSIAAEEIPWKKRFRYRKYFNGFEKISVREEKAAELVRKYSSVPVETLIDPTLMFDAVFWDRYLKKPLLPVPDNYILYYGLGDDDDSRRVEAVAEEASCNVISLREGNEIFNIGPSEFLYLIKNARCVFTDSYHGTIFSVLYGKPFVHLQRKQSNLNTASRFDTLTSKLGLTMRTTDEVNGSNLEDGDYTEVYEKLQKERKKVLTYLESCMKK